MHGKFKEQDIDNYEDFVNQAEQMEQSDLYDDYATLRQREVELEEKDIIKQVEIAKLKLQRDLLSSALKKMENIFAKAKREYVSSVLTDPKEKTVTMDICVEEIHNHISSNDEEIISEIVCDAMRDAGYLTEDVVWSWNIQASIEVDKAEFIKIKEQQ